MSDTVYKTTHIVEVYDGAEEQFAEPMCSAKQDGPAPAFQEGNEIYVSGADWPAITMPEGTGRRVIAKVRHLIMQSGDSVIHTTQIYLA